jgi:hypothetical protein
MKSSHRAKIPELGPSPEQPGPFFSAQDISCGDHQEHVIFRRNQWKDWMRVYTKQTRGQRLTARDVQKIEPAATLILRVWEVGLAVFG